MEPQRPSQYPFLRMQPFPSSQDTRNPPLPPPPYSASSSSSHNNPTPIYDPFRTRESDAQRRTQTPPFSTQMRGANGTDYSRQAYPGSSGRPQGGAHDTHMRQSSYGSGSIFGSNGEGLRGHVDGGGKQQSIRNFEAWVLSLRSAIFCGLASVTLCAISLWIARRLQQWRDHHVVRGSIYRVDILRYEQMVISLCFLHYLRCFCRKECSRSLVLIGSYEIMMLSAITPGVSPHLFLVSDTKSLD